MVILFSVMIGWNYFFQSEPADNKTVQQQTVEKPSDALRPLSLSGITPPAVSKDRADIIQESTRLTIGNQQVAGSINLTGARFDDLTLLKYHNTTDKKSANITLLSPEGAKNAYFAEFGWVPSDDNTVVPGVDSVWKAEGPSTIVWNNGAGLTFSQEFKLDENYMLNVSQRVTNNTDKPVTLHPYGQVTRVGTPETSGFFILHEGPIGYINDKLEEVSYEDLQKKQEIRQASNGGWIGITDKYWLTAFLPDQAKRHEHFFRHKTILGTETYHTGFSSEALTIAPGATAEVSSNIFAGAKVLGLLDSYEETLGVKHFDLAVDFGWFYFITKPTFHALTLLNGWLGNFGLAILLFTVLLRICFLPLASKSFRSMSRMKQLQPQMEGIKKRFADDKMRLNQEIMALYKKEKVNPMAGCLPMIIQMPVFFALYKVIFVSIEMRHAPFFGWIKDLSAADPTTIFNLFGLIPFDPPSFLHIGILPILMGLAMFAQQKLNPAPADPIQARMFMLMPLVITFVMGGFPAGVVIFWTWSNLLSMAQQWIIQRSVAKGQLAASSS